MIDLLWPDVPLDVGRNRLRQALSTLRSVLEPPGGAAVLLADRRGVRLVAGSLGCDVPVFNEALRRGDVAAAARVYGGDLLPGHYDEWVLDERRRLAALADGLQAAADERAANVLPALGAPLHRLALYLTRWLGSDAAGAALAAAVQQQRWRCWRCWRAAARVRRKTPGTLRCWRWSTGAGST